MKYLNRIQQKQPLIHCMTNYVVANFQANGLLAIGASPVMADSKDEVQEMTGLASGLLLNIGTLNQRTVEAMLLAGKQANSMDIPVVLDPVGAGATTFRKQTTLKMLRELNITLLRCNGGELAAIAGKEWTTKGVDSGYGEGDLKNIAEEIANRYQCLVAVTGKEDILTDGNRTIAIPGGDAHMTCITGSGCLLSALCCAFLSVAENEFFEAVSEGLTFYKRVGEYAGRQADNLGGFAVEIINGITVLSMEPFSPEAVAVTMTIAGSDSGGGAGIQADLKTFQELGVFGTSTITAITAQNTLGVYDVYPVDPQGVALQIQSILQDFNVKSIKTGMLFSAPIIREVAQTLRQYPEIMLVIDPVMIAKGGTSLLLDEAIEVLKRELIPLATVITPNIPEAEVLADMHIETDQDIETAAKRILALGVEVVVIKGGHHQGRSLAEDAVFSQSEEVFKIQSPWVHTKDTHGTGCTFSAALTANLALGKDVKQSIVEAKKFIYAAISNGLQLGHGHGPTNHWAFQKMKGRICHDIHLQNQRNA